MTGQAAAFGAVRCHSDYQSDDNVMSAATSYAGTTEPPEVFLFPGLGDMSELALLRAGCEPALRFVPINVPTWTEIYANGIDLGGLIAQCMTQIETHAPLGPLRLAGYSFGGLIAFAVASAFAASGRVVALLGMIDSEANPARVNVPLSPINQLSRLASAIRRGEMAPEIGRLISGMLIRSPWLLRRAARIRHIRLPLIMDEQMHVRLQMRARIIMLRELFDRMATTDAPLDIDAVLFRCVGQELGTTDDLGWGRHLARLRIVPIAGDHKSFKDPANIASLCVSFIAAMRSV